MKRTYEGTYPKGENEKFAYTSENLKDLIGKMLAARTKLKKHKFVNSNVSPLYNSIYIQTTKYHINFKDGVRVTPNSFKKIEDPDDLLNRLANDEYEFTPSEDWNEKKEFDVLTTAMKYPEDYGEFRENEGYRVIFKIDREVVKHRAGLMKKEYFKFIKLKYSIDLVQNYISETDNNVLKDFFEVISNAINNPKSPDEAVEVKPVSEEIDPWEGDTPDIEDEDGSPWENVRDRGGVPSD